MPRSVVYTDTVIPNICVRCERPLAQQETVVVGRRRDYILEAICLGLGVIVTREGNMHWGYTRDDQLKCPH